MNSQRRKMKSAEDGSRMKKKKRDEKEIICQKMDKSEHGTNNKRLSFFKTGFRERRESAKNATTNGRKHHHSMTE